MPQLMSEYYTVICHTNTC